MYYIIGSHYCISETKSDMKKVSTDNILRSFQSTQMTSWCNLCFILFVLCRKQETKRNWCWEEEIVIQTGCVTWSVEPLKTIWGRPKNEDETLTKYETGNCQLRQLSQKAFFLRCFVCFLFSGSIPVTEEWKIAWKFQTCDEITKTDVKNRGLWTTDNSVSL